MRKHIHNLELEIASLRRVFDGQREQPTMCDDIRLRAITTTLSDGSNVVDVYLDKTKFLACSEKDADELMSKLTAAITEHTLNRIYN